MASNCYFQCPNYQVYNDDKNLKYEATISISITTFYPKMCKVKKTTISRKQQFYLVSIIADKKYTIYII